MPAISIAIHKEIQDMDSFDLDKEIGIAIGLLDDQDAAQLHWLAELLLDKALRIEGDGQS